MKKINIIYNQDCEYVLNIVSKYCKDDIIKTTYNTDNYKEKKKALPIMVRNGTKNVPLITLINEDDEEYKVLWSENHNGVLDWENSIEEIFK